MHARLNKNTPNFKTTNWNTRKKKIKQCWVFLNRLYNKIKVERTWYSHHLTIPLSLRISNDDLILIIPNRGLFCDVSKVMGLKARCFDGITNNYNLWHVMELARDLSVNLLFLNRPWCLIFIRFENWLIMIKWMMESFGKVFH